MNEPYVSFSWYLYSETGSMNVPISELADSLEEWNALTEEEQVKRAQTYLETHFSAKDAEPYIPAWAHFKTYTQ